ncbi:type II toxin-antitoxin system HigB family toxin [Dyadobacter aurulentus]|uniref:type II toxin-antitoxin system HigB family toxin n=1 Tax=Dyadobacter sp. UC 10 TaxID=2605428 RepID=UPI0011F107B0|nr:type II toxin-antitoxin system HigB family toxin [Dyadobacter sp. UC 10]KAA0989698.1 type II toxin-antitoxin system HigB family toxin [Dyadobacter sp. UC 10]
MRLQGKGILFRLRDKNRGNVKLSKAIDQLIQDLENAKINSLSEIKLVRSDAEKVHNAGYYFVDIHNHRTLILVVIEDQEATIVWAGHHQDYERTFRNNKKSIEKWLKNNSLL